MVHALKISHDIRAPSNLPHGLQQDTSRVNEPSKLQSLSLGSWLFNRWATSSLKWVTMDINRQWGIPHVVIYHVIIYIWIYLVVTHLLTLANLIELVNHLVRNPQWSSSRSRPEVCEWMTNQAVYDVAWSEARNRGMEQSLDSYDG